MRKVRRYTISKESFEDMCKAKKFNPGLQITFRDKNGIHHHILSAGYSDDICVYRENQQTFILTQNPRLGYVGLEVFEGDDKSEDIFLEAHQVIEVLGRDDLAPLTVIRRLCDYLYL
jgi:hypothetical protein